MAIPQLPASSVLVVGGGVGGMRAAVDLAEAGLKVYLVESLPWLGGRVAQLGYMFPTHDCVLCRGTSDPATAAPGRPSPRRSWTSTATPTLRFSPTLT
ncbi:MAG: FAD-dependent oxidoreductase [Thermoflexia bacterium]|nr:MAG: FAD-dependent oxidoreductase [Thermoflexia bacterium]